MMSLRNNLVPVVVLLLTVPCAQAGITEIAKKTELTKIESMARIPKDADASNRFSCWQDGRLIFQASGMRTAAGKGLKPTLELGSDGKSIELMDFKNGLCIFERQNGS